MRMRRLLPFLVVAVVAALLGACDRGAARPEASEGPGATANCSQVQTIPIQGEGHLVGDQEPPVPYNSTPPTSGWHTSTDVAIVARPDDDPLTEPEQVTVLELGGVVVSYNGIDEEQRGRLESLITAHHAGRAALTRYDKLDEGAVALSGWGKLQLCSAVDLDAVEAFIEAYAQR